jgi:hypothetical protein
MSSKQLRVFVVAVSFLVVSMPMFAHHGSAAYDTKKTVTVSGTVTEFNFINPHTLLYWGSKDDGGNVEKWDGELASPARLERNGWSRSCLKPGDQVTVKGYPAKNGAHILWIITVTTSNGTVYGVHDTD